MSGALAEMEEERGLLSAGAVGEDAADDGSNAPPAKRAKSEHEQPALIQTRSARSCFSWHTTVPLLWPAEEPRRCDRRAQT